MDRICESRSVDVTNSVSTTEQITVSGFTRGAVYVPTGSSLTSLTFHVAPHKTPRASATEPGDYLPLQKEDGSAAIAMTVEAGKAYPLPAEIAGVAFAKMVGNTSGMVTLTLTE
ncbi:hypothetical protein KC887_00295 [Candidatus Kaiserbacteria bacterium]|nr:hypothetical protein [Candidatus Kaiserbacteria bacterium]